MRHHPEGGRRKDWSYVLEFKYLKEADTERLEESAIKRRSCRSKEKHYDAELQGRTILIGLAHAARKCRSSGRNDKEGEVRQMKKRIPLGLQSYDKAKIGNYYVVARSLMIQDFCCGAMK